MVDQHSLQAPFVFQLYTGLIKGIKRLKGDPDIEALREKMQSDQTKVPQSDFGAKSRVSDKKGKSSVSKIAKYGISSPKECRLIARLLRVMKPGICIELGTSLGITTAYLSRSAQEGVIYTFEGNPVLCDIAGKNWKKLDCNNISLIRGNIDVTLEDKLAELPEVDFVLIDANHTKKALLKYYGMISEKISLGGMIYIDDIRWSPDMYLGWREIIRDPKVTLSLEFLNNGILFYEEGLMKQHYILSY